MHVLVLNLLWFVPFLPVFVVSSWIVRYERERSYTCTFFFSCQCVKLRGRRNNTTTSCLIFFNQKLLFPHNILLDWFSVSHLLFLCGKQVSESGWGGNITRQLFSSFIQVLVFNGRISTLFFYYSPLTVHLISTLFSQRIKQPDSLHPFPSSSCATKSLGANNKTFWFRVCLLSFRSSLETHHLFCLIFFIVEKGCCIKTMYSFTRESGSNSRLFVRGTREVDDNDNIPDPITSTDGIIRKGITHSRYEDDLAHHRAITSGEFSTTSKFESKSNMATASQESRELLRTNNVRSGLKTVHTQKVVRKTTTVSLGERKESTHVKVRVHIKYLGWQLCFLSGWQRSTQCLSQFISVSFHSFETKLRRLPSRVVKTTKKRNPSCHDFGRRW